MIIRNIELDIDYLDELEMFDVWSNHRVRENKFQACSPFRTEKHPSFACNLENGLWIDSGASNEEWRKGNFLKLLSWLREETWEETEDYLLDKYSPLNVDVETLTLNLNLVLEEEPPIIFSHTDLKNIFQITKYLRGRGVTDRIQQLMNVGYDKKSEAVVLPWHDKDGNIVNMKYRSTKEKYFWYAKGQPIKNHLYGLYLVKILKKEKVYIVESEIDALYLWSLGFPAIALGRAGISQIQRELILNSCITTLVIATDNDRAGSRAGLEIIRELNGYIDIQCINFPNNVKDVNDMDEDTCTRVCKNHRPIRFRIL